MALSLHASYRKSVTALSAEDAYRKLAEKFNQQGRSYSTYGDDFVKGMKRFSDLLLKHDLVDAAGAELIREIGKDSGKLLEPAGGIRTSFSASRYFKCKLDAQLIGSEVAAYLEKGSSHQRFIRRGNVIVQSSYTTEDVTLCMDEFDSPYSTIQFDIKLSLLKK